MMKRVITLLALLVVLGALLPQALLAQGPTPQRAPRPPQSVTAAPVAQPDYGGVWQFGPTTGFQYTRFDGGYYPGDGKVYFTGGRLADNSTSGEIWSFDPATGIYTDMGVALVTPISNYTMNLLQDETGAWGFYLFCGRPPDGTTTNAVQVYYPDTNTAVQLDPADDFPGAGCTSAFNAVYNNMTYVAGGFDPNQTPPNWDYTYTFDPTAAVGSKWTLIPSATLTVARAYIMSAVVDDMIYAMGGAWYDGTTLLNVQTVEVLDPNDATPTWDDAAVADLPVEASSSRAWGFDSDSPYFDPDGTPLAGKIVTGQGFWADETNAVYVYDTGLDYWDVFPFMAEANGRRDHAAEFLPDLGGTGTPGMWVWGGRQDADANVLQSSEYYEVTMGGAACNILLVDDDWDFGDPMYGGGRPYYTSTLEYLGYNYDLWDTVSQGDPGPADLAPYEVVIWFTGYAWQSGVFTPQNEADVGSYLDVGGRFLLSAHDYHWEAGTITPFMQNYLGIQNIVDDVIITITVGTAGNVIGDGLGPYDMARPDDWYTYWPTESQYVGPYDDEVYAAPGAEEPFLYDDPPNTNPNSTNYDGGPFRTVYLGWAFEWIDTVEERAEIMGAALDWLCPAAANMELIPPAQAGDGAPGATVPYDLTILNNLGFPETFDITYDSDWAFSGPATVGPVADGMTLTFVVSVTVPTDVLCLDVGRTNITATAQSDPASLDTAFIDTGVTPGTLMGVVYDANTGLGIPDAFVELAPTADDWSLYYSTHADASGAYTLTDVAACTFNFLKYTGYGYVSQYYSITIIPADTIVMDVYLDASMPELSDSAVSVDVLQDSTFTYTLVLSNNGSGDLLFHFSEVNHDSGYPLPGGFGTMPSGVDPQVYADLAASPDGTTRFIVYMAEQANLDAAFAMDWETRGHYVLDTLQSTAARTQAGLLAELDAAGVAYESRYIVNAIAVEGDVHLVESIAARPEVAYIGANDAIPAPAPVEMGPSVEGIDAVAWNVQWIDADDVWSTFGVTGTGIVVSNIDTGVQYDHPALVNQYRGNLGGGSFDHNYNWWDPYGDQPGAPYDYHSHGSHTMGTMLGDDGVGEQIGIAPGGQWLACNGFEQGGSGYEFELLECAEFILAPWDLSGTNPMPDLRPHVVNNSWGGGAADWWYNQAIYAWHAAGIFDSWSAGNAGPYCETIGSPDYPSNMQTGATGYMTDDIAGFSSRGPADVTGIMKPDVSAPGVRVWSAYNNGGYGEMGGTSMASPHVGGLAALLWSAQPELIGDVQLTQWVIEQTAVGITTTEGCGGDGPNDIPNNTYGWGRIDALEAVSMALSVAWDIPWLDVDPMMGDIAPMTNQEINLLLDSTGLMTDTCYSGTLKVEYNDPYVVEEFVPVELCVVPCGVIESVDFNWSPTTPTVGMTVTFDAMIVGTPTLPVTYDWNFGDGNMGTGATAIHIYTATGTYTVTVTAMNPCSQVEATYMVTVEPAVVEYNIYLPLVLKSF